jgi:KUP system potassium uptake protein
MCRVILCCFFKRHFLFAHILDKTEKGWLDMEKKKRFQPALFLIAIGIVYGDIGTSPLYVMKSILAGNGGISQVDEAFIIGSLSLVIWTMTLLTTIKYVMIAMKADNHGEGGTFALYALVKSHKRWLIFPAMLGGAALLSDGVLTPAVTVTTAVEGLRSIDVMNRFFELLGGKAVMDKAPKTEGRNILMILAPAK